ncbi:MAG: hypothetical protein [Cressdnaviricota sp.]|nr:MAG: hypothetical protein [Cressdnaviricota sp.]
MVRSSIAYVRDNGRFARFLTRIRRHSCAACEAASGAEKRGSLVKPNKSGKSRPLIGLHVLEPALRTEVYLDGILVGDDASTAQSRLCSMVRACKPEVHENVLPAHARRGVRGGGVVGVVVLDGPALLLSQLVVGDQPLGTRGVRERQRSGLPSTGGRVTGHGSQRGVECKLFIGDDSVHLGVDLRILSIRIRKRGVECRVRLPELVTEQVRVRVDLGGHACSKLGRNPSNTTANWKALHRMRVNA